MRLTKRLWFIFSLSRCLRLIYGLWAGLTAALKDYLDRNLKDCLGGVSYIFPFILVYISFMFYGFIGALIEAI
jgi:hypothetical protein